MKISTSLTKISALLCSFFLLSFSSCSFTAQNGKNIGPLEYEGINYFVNFYSEDIKSVCGGQLIAGKWLITARHCTPSWDGEDNFIAEFGETMSLTIYQGVGGVNGYSKGMSRIIYSGEAEYFTFGSESEVESRLENEIEKSGLIDELSSIMYQYDFNREDSSLVENVKYDVISSTGADVAIIKIGNDVSYSNTLVLGDSSDLEAVTNSVSTILSASDIDTPYNTQPVTDEGSFAFYGWGDDEFDNSPDVMQFANVSINRASLEFNCLYLIEYEDDSNNYLDCDEFEYKSNISIATPYIYASFKDKFESEPVLNSGDSGSALVSNNVAYGLAKGITSTKSVFTSIGIYRNWIAGIIDALNVPTSIELLDTDHREFITISVQNMKQESVYFTPYVESGDIYIDYSSCPEILYSLDSCDITVKINSNTDFKIQMDSSTLTTVTYVSQYSGTYFSNSSEESESLIDSEVNSLSLFGLPF